MDFDDLDEVQGVAEGTLEEPLLTILQETGAPEQLKDFLLQEELTSCRKFFEFIKARDADGIKAEVANRVAALLSPPCTSSKEQIAIRNAWKRCRVAAEEEGGGAETAEADDAGRKTIKSLREMTDSEFAKVPRFTPPEARPRYSKKKWKEMCDKEQPGRHFGLMFPHTLEDLEEMGAKWLTRAFHAAGSVPRDNSVKSMQITPLSLDPLAGDAMGGSSIKARIDLEYATPDPELHTKLFAKMPLTPTDVCERFEHHKWYIDEPEVMFNRLVAPICPFRVPKTYFTDHDPETTNFIHLVEWIEYTGDWEPTRPGVVARANQKVFDTEIPKLGIERYMALLRALATFVAEFQTGRLGDKLRLAQVFEGMEPCLQERTSEWPLTLDEWSWRRDMAKSKEYQDNVLAGAQGQANLSQFQMQVGLDFAGNVCPQLFPKDAVTPKFLLTLYQEVMHIQQHNMEINWYTQMYPEMFSLFHPNTQLDNGFYSYTDEACTTMGAGIFDWAGVKAMPFIPAIAGNLQSGAEAEMMEEHEEGMIQMFTNAYHEHGGSARLTLDIIRTCFKLSFTTCVPGTMGFIKNILTDCPKTDPLWKNAKSFRSPEIETNFMKRVNIGGIVHMLQAWKSPKRRLYASFLEWQKANEEVVFKRPIPSDLALPKAK